MSKNTKADMFVDIVALHDEVTGSCNICTVRLPDQRRIKFIVDCGLFQEEKYQRENYYFPFDPREIDFALVTHNHIDHIGRIPKLYKDGFNGPTYASTTTSELMTYALNNTAEIFEAATSQNQGRVRHAMSDSSVPVYLANLMNAPLFDKDDVSYAMDNVYGVEFNRRIKIDPNVSVMFAGNGHLLGASSILVTISYPGQRSINLFFSGDYAKTNMFFDVKAMPKNIYELPVTVIEESTYGTTSNSTIKRVFDDNLLESMDMGHTFVAPVFALGRTQEILLKIRRLQEAGKLDPTIPIFLDGNLAQSYTSYYNHHKKLLIPEARDFVPENLSMIHEFAEREALLKKGGSKVILTTSGMGSYGPAQFYLPYFITRADATIHFCGFTTPNTFGRVLQDTPQGELIDVKGVMVEKKARVLATNEFSGHGKKEDLLESIERFPNAKSVLVNHGEKATKQSFAQSVTDTIHPSKGVEVLGPDVCVRVGAYGIIKTLPVTDLEFKSFDAPEEQSKGRQKQKLFRRKMQ